MDIDLHDVKVTCLISTWPLFMESGFVTERELIVVCAMCLLFMLCFGLLGITVCLVKLRRNVIFEFALSLCLDRFPLQIRVAKINISRFVKKVPLRFQAVRPKDEARLSRAPCLRLCANITRCRRSVGSAR